MTKLLDILEKLNNKGGSEYMYSILRRNDDIVYGVTEYVCDS
jgi:hypothetical protein